MAERTPAATSARANEGALLALERYQPAVVEELRRIVPGGPDGPYSAMRYHLGWEDERGRPASGRGGKLLRPALCLLACEAAGGDRERALPAAAAVELLHNFTLIHDDIEDVSEQRHGRPTVWRVWGVAQAINAGDGLFALARVALQRLRALGHPPERVLDTAGRFDEAAVRLCEGQHLDLAYAGGPAVSSEQYLSMIEGKTGALLAASCAIGALLAEAGRSTVEAMHGYGFHLGLAFQIRDDYLGIWGDERLTGKPAGDDIRGQKKSYPVVVAFERAAGQERDELERLYGASALSESEIARVIELLERAGARRETERAAIEQAEAAIERLRGVELRAEQRRELEDLARFAAERSA